MSKIKVLKNVSFKHLKENGLESFYYDYCNFKRYRVAGNDDDFLSTFVYELDGEFILYSKYNYDNKYQFVSFNYSRVSELVDLLTKVKNHLEDGGETYLLHIEYKHFDQYAKLFYNCYAQHVLDLPDACYGENFSSYTEKNFSVIADHDLEFCSIVNFDKYDPNFENPQVVGFICDIAEENLAQLIKILKKF
jgi:hypothetical protein